MSVDAKTSTLKKMFRQFSKSDRPLTQVDRVVFAFGGVPALRGALEAVGKPRSKITIYRWNYPRSKGGAGGVIPSSAMADIIAAARYAGILLTTDHLDPRPTYGETAGQTLEEIFKGQPE